VAIGPVAGGLLLARFGWDAGGVIALVALRKPTTDQAKPA
jgi:hypothetical protein